MPAPEVPLLAEDDDLLVVDKPAGWQTLVAEGRGRNCLTTVLRDRGPRPGLVPVHRLDRDTTGVQVFAKTPAAREALEAAFRERRTEKAYLALCLGVPRNRTGTIRRRLSDWSGGRRPVSVVKGRGGLEAETAYAVIRSDGAFPASLLLFRPREGRTHQVRVHAAALGRPVLGDDQYGDRPANARAKARAGLARQALHAWRLLLPDPRSGHPLHLEAPLPADMAALADALFPDWPAALRELPFPG
jgi:23S rRNA pseudouridine1911/1915/1917 synthase